MEIAAFLADYYNKHIAPGSLADTLAFFDAVKIPQEGKA